MKEPTQFEIDYARIVFSLNCRPMDWYRGYSNYVLYNLSENMEVWTGSQKHIALYFKVGDRTHGGLTGHSVFFGWVVPWRRRLLKIMLKAINSPFVNDYDTYVRVKYS